MNKVFLLGNVGQDPDVKVTQGDNKYARFSLATNEFYKDKNGDKQQKTEWHNIVMWNKKAEVVEKYIKKGSKMLVEGKLTHRSFENNEGKTIYITEVIGMDMTMLDSKDGSSTPPPPPPPETEKKSNKSKAAVANQTAQNGEPPVDENDDDDLPF